MLTYSSHIPILTGASRLRVIRTKGTVHLFAKRSLDLAEKSRGKR